jgi:hypothetical protein
LTIIKLLITLLKFKLVEGHNVGVDDDKSQCTKSSTDFGFNWHETCKAYVPSSSDTLVCPETTRKRQLPQLSNSPEGSF